ncbi:MFS general substrate transporter [Rhizoctonia solani AG-3 Rhs1AP]|uniref:MFS general substrate transporter n=2 Tax=Rhizoctonia solani AG-3 TaxID=1086053 RepID=A0A074SAT0_9AGAM|nr:MFS general substrate transporter [Rhizoctonia solani AG-3 Rhs1AP]KEP54710.1 MFS general substrate transporter [Rhizoctonia solani 123E]
MKQDAVMAQPDSPERSNATPEASIYDKDAAAVFLADLNVQDQGSEIDPEAERRLLRKIDLLLMPLLTISYGLQYYDKAIFSSASVFGLLQDMDLIITSGNPPVSSTTRFSTATAAFYWGFLAASYPMSLLLQRFPVGKTLSLMVIIWGVVVMLTVVVTSYPGIIVQRVFLGVIESAVSPGFVIISSMWYKRSEQPMRIGIWYSATGLFSIFSGAVNYGIGKSAQDAPLATWKYMYIFAGSWTIAWGFLLLFLLPDNPMSARLFTLEERQLAVRRLQDNMTGVESKKFKRSQFIEAITDIKIWIFMLMGAALYVTNGGVTAFGAQIVKSFGYSSLKTILMLTPGGATTALSIYVTGWIAARWKNSRTLLIPITCIPVMVGAIMIWKYDWSHRGPLLVVTYISSMIQIFGAPYVLLLSLSTANVAGHTKKTFSAAAIFIGYNVGNIVAPYLIDTTTRAQHYPKAWISIIVVMVFSSVASLVLRGIYIAENKRRDSVGRQEVKKNEYDNKEHGEDRRLDNRVAEGAAWSDLTDKQNPYFRYVY